MTSIADSHILTKRLGERPRQRRPARDQGLRPGVLGGTGGCRRVLDQLGATAHAGRHHQPPAMKHRVD